jgi:hypothetical protein
MTMRTRYKLVCKCGHEGHVKLSENDQPYSTSWESYTLEGFNGGSYYVEGAASIRDAFEAMKPKCPQCGRFLTTDDLMS